MSKAEFSTPWRRCLPSEPVEDNTPATPTPFTQQCNLARVGWGGYQKYLRQAKLETIRRNTQGEDDANPQ